MYSDFVYLYRYLYLISNFVYIKTTTNIYILLHIDVALVYTVHLYCNTRNKIIKKYTELNILLYYVRMSMDTKIPKKIFLFVENVDVVVLFAQHGVLCAVESTDFTL